MRIGSIDTSAPWWRWPAGTRATYDFAGEDEIGGQPVEGCPTKALLRSVIERGEDKAC